jgi:hypothetical protein
MQPFSRVAGSSAIHTPTIRVGSLVRKYAASWCHGFRANARRLHQRHFLEQQPADAEDLVERPMHVRRHRHPQQRGGGGREVAEFADDVLALGGCRDIGGRATGNGRFHCHARPARVQCAGGDTRQCLQAVGDQLSPDRAPQNDKPVPAISSNPVHGQDRIDLKRSGHYLAPYSQER